MVTELTLVIISQYTQISNHCVTHLKLTQCYMSIMSQFLKIRFFMSDNCIFLKKEPCVFVKHTELFVDEMQCLRLA